MSNNAVTEVGEFFTSWETYRKVLENNYMYHKEIYQAVGMLLHQQFAHQPFKLLDLGVGMRVILPTHYRVQPLAITQDLIFQILP
jgi:hypothetical protein